MANAINHFDHVDWLLVEEYQVIVVVFIETKNELVSSVLPYLLRTCTIDTTSTIFARLAVTISRQLRRAYNNDKNTVTGCMYHNNMIGLTS